MRCELYIGRSAGPMRRAMCFDGPARTTAHEMWYITAAAAMTSTVLMRPLTCFHGPALAVAHDMWFTTATTTTCLGVPGSLSAKTCYVRMMHFWKIAPRVFFIVTKSVTFQLNS